MEEANLGSGHRIHLSSLRVEKGTVQIKHCNAAGVKLRKCHNITLSGILSTNFNEITYIHIDITKLKVTPDKIKFNMCKGVMNEGYVE